jgi:transposase InsO family protein
VRRAENEFELKLKKVKSDNGSEFKNTNVEEFCDEKGIKHEFSTTYTPEQNGVVERKNRILIEMARSMLDEYKVSNSFCAKAINAACHASNRLYCHRFFNKTPYELLNGRKPNISYFRFFGCKCYILRKGSRLSKFQSKCLMRDFFLDILQIPKLIEYTTSPRDLLRKHIMCNLIKQWALKMRKKI